MYGQKKYCEKYFFNDRVWISSLVKYLTNYDDVCKSMLNLFYNEIVRQKKFNLPQSQKKKKTKAKGYKKNLEI